MKPKTKRFDCVEMKRRGAEKIMQEIQGMTREEELQYWRRGTEELRRLQRSTKSRSPVTQGK